MKKDLENRDPVDVIREIARDMLAGRELILRFQTGRQYPVRGLDINAVPLEYPDKPFTLRLEYYDMDADELFEFYGDQIVIRSADETKTYWSGFNTERNHS